MGAIRNIFALIGLLAVIAGGVVVVKSKDALSAFDPDAPKVYHELVENILSTKNAAEATVWKFEVAEGLSPEEVEETMKFVANEHNMSNVGELPLYKQASLRPRERFWDIQVPKIDSAFDNLLLPRTSWSPQCGLTASRLPGTNRLGFQPSMAVSGRGGQIRQALSLC
ncbi:hypothetical protein [Solemya velesiana gill symbiont]|uniref:hypothetical protein n=1 Tax=Solemya velesiana gill symbiont TaxID=1918948 RepID=UPI001560090E|nr:hypothetical protein [Solemya velesiana gill symbiont]